MTETTDNESRKAPFDMLADELVLNILELLIYHDCPTDPCGCLQRPRFAVWRVALVCRRFSRLITPYLYRTLYFTRTPIWTNEDQYRMGNPLCRQHCHKLDILIPEYKRQSDKARLIARFVDGSNPENWQHVDRMLKHMRRIKHLHLQCVGLWVPQILEHINVPTLQLLDISCRAKASEGGFPDRQIGTASFTTLRLSAWEGDAAAIAHLIQWPRQLRRFYFENHQFYHVNRDSLDLTMFGSWLSVHKDTLETIDIGSVSPSSGELLLDVSEFRQLKSLKLSRWSSPAFLEFPLTNVDRLLAPNLEEFIWSFNFDSKNVERWDTWNVFKDRDELWLQQFVKVAARKQSPLKKIHVIVNPDASNYLKLREEDGYPWDRLERVKEYSRRRNIELSYPPPTRSRDWWRRKVARDRARAEWDTYW
ncbi:hypothetical protein F4779DRAFT_488305 [Xylariaceae sp. FL0662B]|nr:hypothetical protein F4779DRAFT_488305 [Xylariaceae sp. FL0662B]